MLVVVRVIDLVLSLVGGVLVMVLWNGVDVDSTEALSVVQMILILLMLVVIFLMMIVMVFFGFDSSHGCYTLCLWPELSTQLVGEGDFGF